MRLATETKIEDMVIGHHRRPHFVTAIPTFGMVPIEFVVAFGRLQIPVNAASASMIIKGMEIGHARNMIVEKVLAMENPPRYIFMFGDDMLPPWDGLVKLYEVVESDPSWDVLTGLYYWKGYPPTPLMWRDDAVGPMVPGVHFQLGEVVQVGVTGMDFTLIRVDFLKQVTPPNGQFFRTGPGMFNRQNVVASLFPEDGKKEAPPASIVTFTEDVWFCDLVRQAGGRVGVHTGVRVAHLDVRTGVVY